MTVAFTVKNMGNYGYASIYLTYNGVYAYGFIILKAPEKKPEIYIMAGDQNHWLGPVRDVYIGEEIIIHILILENKTLLYNISGKTGKYNLTYLPPLTTLHLVVGNVTGRTSMAPKIVFNKIIVYVTNSSLSGREINIALLHGYPPQSMVVGLNMSFTPIITTTVTTTLTPIITSSSVLNTTTTTTRSITMSSSTQPGWGEQQSFAVVITIIVLVIVIMFLLRKKISAGRNE